MKSYFTLLALVLFSISLDAATLNSYGIRGEYLYSSSQVWASNYENREIKADVTISRALKSYGYENIDWIITLVYVTPGNETAISVPLNYSSFNHSSPAFVDLIITGQIPAGYSGGTIKLKYQFLMYNNDGGLISSSRNTDYSFTTYTTYAPPPASYNSANARFFMSNPNGINFRKSDYTTGGFVDFGVADWANIEGITSMSSYLYVVQGGTLHKVSPVDGSYTIIGSIGIWNGTNAITASSNGYIYIIQNSRVHKVNATTGSYTILGNPEWTGTEALLSYDGNLYIVQAAELYKFNENTGSYVQLGSGTWGGTRGMATFGDGYLYLVQNGYLHKVNITNGTYTILGTQNWVNTNKQSVAAFNNYLYIINNKRIFKVDKAAGTYLDLGDDAYANNKFLTIL